MSAVYFYVSNIHLTDNHMNENSNTDCVVDVTNVEISDNLGQNLPEWQIYPSIESPGDS